MAINPIVGVVTEGERPGRRSGVGRLPCALVSGADTGFAVYPARKVVWRDFSEKLGAAVDRLFIFRKVKRTCVPR